MKTITFPVGYRPEYLTKFLDCLKNCDLSDYKIICSAEKCQPCIDILENCELPLTILHKENSSGVRSAIGLRDNTYNVLSYAFKSGSDFNVHLEDDLVLSLDVFYLSDWYYNTFKDKPLTFMSYGLFNQQTNSDDFCGLEIIASFEGLGWCTFKEGWELCFNKYWYDDTYARKYFNSYGWDWAMAGAYREFGYKGIRPLIARTNHYGKYDGTHCTPSQHDDFFTNLGWNKTQIIKEFKLPEDI
jgi:hypothetical protein